MRAGPLRHRIRIEQLTRTRDDYGGHSETWSLLREVWAEVLPVNGREYFTAEMVNSETTHKMRIRYFSPKPTPDMRVVYNGSNYDIESVIEIMERRREIMLMCKVRSGSGFRADGH